MSRGNGSIKSVDGAFSSASAMELRAAGWFPGRRVDPLPLLARLAVSLGRPQAAVGLDQGAGNALDPDGPGVDRPTLERIVAQLEGEP